jgi:hypothetical protein
MLGQFPMLAFLEWYQWVCLILLVLVIVGYRMYRSRQV